MIALTLILAVTLTALDEVDSSCVKAKLCCQGKDVTCIVPGERSGNVDGLAVEGNGTCFCDAGCIDIGDCCKDYRDQCKPVDCVLDDKWQEWEACDASCGLGIKHRSRRVVQQTVNGGKPCGKTVQRAVCEGTRCKLPRASGTVEEMREIGKILPIAWGGWRKNKRYNPYEDIRRNIFLHLENPTGIPYNRPSYCAVFELTEVRPGCHLLPWTMMLTKGSSVCVECQAMAMHKKLGGRCKGHGVYLRETRWAAVGVSGCHGTWLMKSHRRDCGCSNQGSSFILV